MVFLRLAASLLAALLALSGAATAEQAIVYKSPACDCCSKWVTHMRDNGIDLAQRDMQKSQLSRLKASLGLKPEQASCHTATIEGYVVEGHVPAQDVKRLLAEKPDAIGLSVPLMPVGSPGMEAGDTKVPYEVLLVKKDGTTEVWAKY